MSFFDVEAQSSGISARNDVISNKSPDPSGNLISEFAEELKNLERECNKIATKRDSADVRSKIETGLIPHCNSIRDKIEEQRWSGNGPIVEGSKLYNDFKMLKDTLQKLERDYSDKKLKNAVRKRNDDAKRWLHFLHSKPL